jgi:hypothetical protein
MSKSLKTESFEEMLHKVKRDKNTPQPLIDFFDTLASMPPGLTAQERVRWLNKAARRALERLQRKDA